MRSKNSRTIYVFLTVLLAFVVADAAEANAQFKLRVRRPVSQRSKAVKRSREIPRAPAFLLGLINGARIIFDKDVTRITVVKPPKVIRRSHTRGKNLLRALYLDVKDTWSDPYQHYFDHREEATALWKSGRPFHALLQLFFVAPVWAAPVIGPAPSDNKRGGQRIRFR